MYPVLYPSYVPLRVTHLGTRLAALLPLPLAASFCSLAAAFQIEDIRRAAHDWPTLALAAVAPVSDLDRLNARLAASKIKGESERLVGDSESIVRRAEALGIASRTVDPTPTKLVRYGGY